MTWPMGCSLLTPKIVLSRTEPQWPTVVTGSLTHLWLASSPFLSYLSAPSWGFWISPQTNDLLSDFCLRVCFWGPNLRTVPHLQMKRGKPLEAKQLVYSPTRRGRAAFLNCRGLFQSHWTLLFPWGRKCFPAQIQQIPDGPSESVEHLACSFTIRGMKHQGRGHPCLVPTASSLDREWRFKRGQKEVNVSKGPVPPLTGFSLGDLRAGRERPLPLFIWVNSKKEGTCSRPHSLCWADLSLVPGICDQLGDVEEGESTLVSGGTMESFLALLDSPAHSLNCFYICFLIGSWHLEQKGP